MAAGASERSRRARSGSRLGARAAGRAGARARACPPQQPRGPGARSRRRMGPRGGAPLAAPAGGRGRGPGARGGERPGRRARGGAHAGLRGEHAPGARRVCAKPPPPHSAPGPSQTSGRAAAGPTLSPRPPARPPGGAHCARPAPPGRPEPARDPQRARRPGPASSGPRRPPAGEARELGESRGARRPGPPRQGVGAPGAARFRFRPGQRSLEALVSDAETGSCRPLLPRGPVVPYGQAGVTEEERRGAGPGEWGLAVRFARPSPSRSRPALRRVAGGGTALLSAVRTREGGKRLGPRTHTRRSPGACAVWAPQRSAGCVRARSSGKGSRPASPGVTIGFRATPEDGLTPASHHLVLQVTPDVQTTDRAPP
ncbi:translation initiation factor IF-2-like [Leopardus geoffroyi]|uniref:translation initiation factor IF-2-like n=1 Tax=Leopardus geoffroyi TaxID=46844 RepID=UPI001E2630D8|nr:translation initiation factor IF-2-like [Leopardus geoffroyi]